MLTHNKLAKNSTSDIKYLDY